MAALCGRFGQLTCRRPLSLIPRRFHSVDKEPMQSTVTFVTDTVQEDGSIPPYVTKYSTQGFRIKNIKVFGSVAILPEAFFHWKIQRPEEITPESLALFTITEPPIDILVVGTGERIVRLSPEIIKHMKANKIMLEVQDTRNAAATFNFLLEENRLVGAALIPPQTIKD